MKVPILLPSLLLAAAGLLCPREARACAVCSCGDPTLTTMGAEQPFDGRLRAATEARYRVDAIGTPDVDQLLLREVKTDLALSWSPDRRVTVALSAPLLWREVTTVNLSRTQVWGLGDVEARARWLVYRDRDFAPRTLVAVSGGLQAPTAPLAEVDGVALPAAAQPGTGAFAPLVGVSAARFDDPRSVYASATVWWPLPSDRALQPGPSLRLTGAGQVQPRNDLGVRVGLDGRLDAVALEGGVVEEDSGGFVAFLTGDLLYSPAEDVVVRLGGAVPVVNALRGDHVESPMATLGVIYDF